MIELFTGPLSRIAVIGAHCDDIAIGAGATLLTLAARHPGLRVDALILTGGGTEREREERNALHGFCPGAELDVTVLNVPDGRIPAYWERAKDALATMSRRGDPEVVFAPHRRDAHQDHRLLGELVPTEFRNHLILGYEILKWESDLPNTALYHRVSPEVAETKARMLDEHYPSQRDHDWFDESAFLGLSRLRGAQCKSTHAEAFVVEKSVITFGG